jgi:hypothetical protein
VGQQALPEPLSLSSLFLSISLTYQGGSAPSPTSAATPCRHRRRLSITPPPPGPNTPASHASSTSRFLPRRDIDTLLTPPRPQVSGELFLIQQLVKSHRPSQVLGAPLHTRHNHVDPRRPFREEWNRPTSFDPSARIFPMQRTGHTRCRLCCGASVEPEPVARL